MTNWKAEAEAKRRAKFAAKVSHKAFRRDLDSAARVNASLDLLGQRDTVIPVLTGHGRAVDWGRAEGGAVRFLSKSRRAHFAWR